MVPDGESFSTIVVATVASIAANMVWMCNNTNVTRLRQTESLYESVAQFHRGRSCINVAECTMSSTVQMKAVVFECLSIYCFSTTTMTVRAVKVENG